MTTFQLHPEARKELDGARHYYRERDAEVARRFARSMLGLFERIAAGPTAFPKHGLLAASTSRGVLFFDVHKAVLPRTFPYVVFFYVRAGVAVVLAVAHGKRRPGYWTTRTDDRAPGLARATSARRGPV